MKIAYLFSRYPVPSQTFCDTEIRALEAEGHEIEIYSCSAPTSSFRHGGPADWPRAEVLYAPPTAVLKAWENAARQDGSWPEAMVREHVERFGERYDPARRARHALYFAHRMRGRGIEHLHVHFANRATHAALFVHALTGIPFSFTAHAQDFLVDLGSDALLRLMCERAAFVVAVSEWSRRALVERCPVAEHKIHRVYNGVVVDQAAESAPTPSPPGIGVKIFSVGRLVEFKGFQDLLAACRLLCERGVQFSCEIVGDGPLRETLEHAAAEFSHPASVVRFSGLLPQAEVHRRMAACDIFALACRTDENGASDVLPTVILEAMMHAKPVVSTRLAGVPEMVEDGRTGMLVPPGDVPALADALAALANDAEQRQKLGRAGRGILTERFSAKASARQLSDLFSGVGQAAPVRSTGAASAGLRGRIFWLADRWPYGTEHDDSLAVGEAVSLALAPGRFTNDSTVKREIGYLPDDVVFETYWRQNDALVHRLESWRSDVGGGCATGLFLLACRRALYLHLTLLANSAAGRHLHAVGPQSLLCAWLLRRLGSVATASFVLPAKSEGEGSLTGAVLRKLAPDFVGGWIPSERKLVASLGMNFRSDPLGSIRADEAVSNWAAARPA